MVFVPPFGKAPNKMPHKDPEERREYQRRYREADPERHRQWNRDHRAKNPNCRKEEFQKLKAVNPERYRKQIDYAIARTRSLRDKVLALYGEECECCCESIKEFLAIDHIDGSGKAHREQNMQGSKLYYWLLRPGIPRAGFRILCHNCNFAVRFGDPCPHQLKGEFRRIKWLTELKYVVIKDYRTRYVGE